MKLFKYKSKAKFNTIEDFYKTNPSFCIMPWVHLHVTQEGNVTPCCQARWDKELAFGEINFESMAEIWKGKKMDIFRKSLLKGKKDVRCLKCYEKENDGWVSLRNITNKKYSKEVLKVANNQKNEFDQPIYLDIRFSNKCNLKCRICGPWSSSSWTNDYALLSGDKYQDEYITYGVSNEQKFLKDFSELVPSLNELYFAGGEPLMIDSNYSILKMLLDKKRPDVALFYNSNLTVLDYEKPGILELWNKFSHVTVAASIDDWEAQFEYHRKNAHWKTIHENLGRIKKECPHVNLIISPTVSIYNICRIHEFHKAMVDLGLIKKNDFIPTLLTQPDYYSIQVLPEKLKKKVAFKLEEHIKWITEGSDILDPQTQYVLGQFRNIVIYMNSQNKNILWTDLILREKKLDKIRKENFFSTFVEYKEFE